MRLMQSSRWLWSRISTQLRSSDCRCESRLLAEAMPWRVDFDILDVDFDMPCDDPCGLICEERALTLLAPCEDMSSLFALRSVAPLLRSVVPCVPWLVVSVPSRVVSRLDVELDGDWLRCVLVMPELFDMSFADGACAAAVAANAPMIATMIA